MLLRSNTNSINPANLSRWLRGLARVCLSTGKLAPWAADGCGTSSRSSELFKLWSDGLPAGTQPAKAKRAAVTPNLICTHLLNCQICSCSSRWLMTSDYFCLTMCLSGSVVHSSYLCSSIIVLVWLLLLLPICKTLTQWEKSGKCHKQRCSVLHFWWVIAVVVFSWEAVIVI